MDTTRPRIACLFSLALLGRVPYSFPSGQQRPQRERVKTMITPTAKEQFVLDFTLVVDNTQDAYTEAIDTVKALGTGNKYAIADALRGQFEDYIEAVTTRENELGNTTGALLISQLLIGYNSAFDDIAQHYIETVKESN